MRYFLFALVIAMIGKDVIPIGDIYVMRGIIQGAALLAGIGVIFIGLKAKFFSRNWLVFIYIGIVFISSIFSPIRQYSLLQALSLLGPILFFIGFNQGTLNQITKNNKIVIISYVVLYTLTCIASLIFWKMNPQSMTEVLWNNEIRFTGLFNTPGMMGTAAGLLLGSSFLLRINLPIKTLCLICSAACLYLTLSRTFIVAAAIGLLITVWFYFPKYRKLTFALAGVLGVAITVFFLTFVFAPKVDKDVNKIVRTDSISNLSGRTVMWQKVWEHRLEHPFTGEGFAAGGSLLFRNTSNLTISDPRYLGRTTLHSGYVQALADLGWIGASAYLLNIVLPLFMIYRKDRDRKFPIEFYSLIFLAIANSGESIIYTAANFPTILFWYFCIFANNLTTNRTFENPVLKRPIAAKI